MFSELSGFRNLFVRNLFENRIFLFQVLVFVRDFEHRLPLSLILMALEIERKFLVLDESFKRGLVGQIMMQGYICTQDHKTVRARIADKIAWLTIKGPTTGCSRSEFEFEIPLEEARALLDSLAPDRRVHKTRYCVEHQGHTWDVDVFDGPNAPLVLAEIELDSESDRFAAPPWLGQEVTEDSRYYNSYLAEYPYSTWKET